MIVHRLTILCVGHCRHLGEGVPAEQDESVLLEPHGRQRDCHGLGEDAAGNHPLSH